MSSLPTGTITFLFTDVEGSTRLWEKDPGAMGLAMARHDSLIEGCVATNSGTLVRPRGEGDSRFAVFERAPDAVAAARDIQETLAHTDWPLPAPLRVRLALHSGQADLRAGDYYGTAVNRCARLRALASGGQTLVSQAAYDLTRDQVPERTGFGDLGEHRLKDLERAEHIYQLVIAGLPAGFPPLPSIDTLPNNLPIQLTSFVGREQEMEEVKRRLASTRLLTLTGSGGTGKTRLALQVAADLIETYPDGVWFVDLAPVSDPALVAQTAASVVGAREQPGRPINHTLNDYLLARTLLLILDNCEHLIDACAALADGILRACPRVQILASSREALGIAGETTWPVPSLRVPGTGDVSVESLARSEAVRLLIDRALAVQPGFRLTPTNAAAVAKLCTRLDGIPLALELAASRLRALTVEQLAARLDDRFRLLTGGSRTALPRQQTLRALIDWSYGLLSEQERVLFRRLAVFMGGWTLEAAQTVCGDKERLEPDDILDLLTRLVDKSLVVAQAEETAMRYRMLETIRQYAREKLIESEEVEGLRNAHLAFFSDWAGKMAPSIETRERSNVFALFDSEYDNLRAALAWAIESDASRALALASSIRDYWAARGLASEGRGWIEQALARDAAESSRSPEAAAGRRPERAGALLALSQVNLALGQNASVSPPLQQAADLYRELGDRSRLALCLAMLGMIQGMRGDYEQAARSFEESLELGEAAGARMAVAMALSTRARLFLERDGDTARAGADLESAIAIGRQEGHGWGLGLALRGLAEVRMRQGNSQTARSLLEEGMTVIRQEGNKQFMNIARSALADIARQEGDYGTAVDLYREAIKTWQDIGNRGGIARCLECLAFLAIDQSPDLDGSRQSGALKGAARLFGAAAALREASESPMTSQEQKEFEAELARLRSRLDAGPLNAAWAEGHAMTMEQAMRLAFADLPLS